MNGNQQLLKFVKSLAAYARHWLRSQPCWWKTCSRYKKKKKKIGGDALHVCSSLIIMTEGATSSSIANVAAKSVTQTDRLGGTS